MSRLRQVWDDLRSSFWFMPSLMVAASMAFAAALIELDSAANYRWLAQWPRLFGAGAEGASQMLSTLAGSTMTVMGVTFSMILVALALASSQYTSRILRNFMRSRATQGTLGMFAGIFAYCLIVLRTIRGGEGVVEFVPSMAVFAAFILALVGVGVLIYFIHHIASVGEDAHGPRHAVLFVHHHQRADVAVAHQERGFAQAGARLGERAFRALAGRGVGIAVQASPEPTAAGYSLSGPDEVRALLAAPADAPRP